MLSWLNENASAISAMSAIATLLVTSVLAILTARYVYLTGEIARTTSEQARLLQAATRRAEALTHTGLQMLAIRLRSALIDLEADAPPDSTIRAFSLFSAGDIDQLEALARGTSPEAQAQAMPVALALRWLFGLVQRVQATERGFGYRYTKKEVDEYKDTVQLAVSGLAQLGGIDDAPLRVGV
jgi:hypothetical protein